MNGAWDGQKGGGILFFSAEFFFSPVVMSSPSFQAQPHFPATPSEPETGNALAEWHLYKASRGPLERSTSSGSKEASRPGILGDGSDRSGREGPLARTESGARERDGLRRSLSDPCLASPGAPGGASPWSKEEGRKDGRGYRASPADQHGWNRPGSSSPSSPQSSGARKGEKEGRRDGGIGGSEDGHARGWVRGEVAWEEADVNYSLINNLLGRLHLEKVRRFVPYGPAGGPGKEGGMDAGTG